MKRSGAHGTSAFTIIELLVVIIIIGILLTITAVSYNGITTGARKAPLASDLKQNATLLEAYANNHAGSYPGTQSSAGLKTSNDNTIAYTITANGYCLVAHNSTRYQYITNTKQVPTESNISNCPITFTQIAAGGYHSLALASNGTIYSWGSHYGGQLGNGTTTDSHVPAAIAMPE